MLLSIKLAYDPSVCIGISNSLLWFGSAAGSLVKAYTGEFWCVLETPVPYLNMWPSSSVWLGITTLTSLEFNTSRSFVLFEDSMISVAFLAARSFAYFKFKVEIFSISLFFCSSLLFMKILLVFGTNVRISDSFFGSIMAYLTIICGSTEFKS